MRSRPLKLKLAALATLSLAFALGLGEVVLRLLPEPEPARLAGQISYQDGNGVPITFAEAIQRRLIVAVPGNQTPRRRHTWAPNATFFICYSDHDELSRDWMDEQGRVLVRINSAGIRERETVLRPKASDEFRIVCVGDSFTFGWGVPEEAGWVRLLERELREQGENVTTVNCGAAGALVVDEYQWALEHRFSRFEPDAVIVTICLNDLIPCSGLFVQGFAIDTGSALLDRLRSALRTSPLDLDPDVDWVDLMMGLPREDARYTDEAPYDAMWAQGAPQRALAAMQAWCGERNIKLMVVLWPFLQGLGPGRTYPFAKLHGLVAAECARLGIPFLDVLPALQPVPHEELWVTPADMHANPMAMRLVLPLLVPFVRANCF